MATPYKVSIGTDNTGLWRIIQSQEASQSVSKLLQQDMESHHVFLNDDEFHDHVPHHLLALYGTGASPEDISKAFQQRHPLQRPVQLEHESILAELEASWSTAAKYLGNDLYYPDFLAYFQKTIEARGYEAVVNDYLFKNDDASNDILVRLHAGAIHPLIQLMYGLEWKQPAIVAEALAQTCVHKLEQLDKILLESERRATTRASNDGETVRIQTLYERIRLDPKLRSAARPEDREKIQDGILARAPEEMLSVLDDVEVKQDELQERTAEMFHDIVLVASGAAIHPPKHVKYDFFLMHHINAALIYPTINDQPWISNETKARMLEWKIRMDLIQYTARGAPEYSVQQISNYAPKTECGNTVREIGGSLHSLGDDGHAIKQARAIAVCHELMRLYTDNPWAVLKGDAIWKQIQHMVVDAVESPGRMYVRGAGHEEAWKDVPLQSAPRKTEAELRAIILGQ
ncbi:hypothetical protein LCI18_003052 [Fusarium solani-melongenae]|uniref:Uncharacterized protein n=1 Tax=Fusarium solani subsp. cucurbitae TaxID=2747967 RepID=A0ACD3YT06_FUSSC|nr:hypothetical protein LCI18_003052 [Fusarium solani-melongenae]